jgi:prepilin-type processing-associated H-X9-DG protein
VENANLPLAGKNLADLQTYIAPLISPSYEQRHGGNKFNAVFGDGSVKRVTWSTTPNDKTSVFSMRNVWFQLY